jgi:hypothetical protein
MAQTAVVRMEEGYMRLTLEYDYPNFKTEICKYVGEAENKFEIYPEVIHRRDNKKKCFTSIEFSGDDYICSRSCGDFIETVVSGLGIESCSQD